MFKNPDEGDGKRDGECLYSLFNFQNPPWYRNKLTLSAVINSLLHTYDDFRPQPVTFLLLSQM